MQINELIEKYYFHDSSIIELSHEQDTIKMKIDFCMWMQDGYKEGEDEIKEITLVFDKITDYVWDSDKAESEIDCETILELSYNHDSLKFVLEDNGISIVTFKSKHVVILH